MHTELTASVQRGLGVFYILCALFNAGLAYVFVRARDRGQATLWTAVAGLFAAHGLVYFTPVGARLVIPEGVTHAVDWATNAVTYFLGSCVAFGLLFAFRRFFTAPP